VDIGDVTPNTPRLPAFRSGTVAPERALEHIQTAVGMHLDPRVVHVLRDYDTRVVECGDVNRET